MVQAEDAGLRHSRTQRSHDFGQAYFRAFSQPRTSSVHVVCSPVPSALRPWCQSCIRRSHPGGCPSSLSGANKPIVVKVRYLFEFGRVKRRPSTNDVPDDPLAVLRVLRRTLPPVSRLFHSFHVTENPREPSPTSNRRLGAVAKGSQLLRIQENVRM
jgi:hypothetical protein